MWDKGGMWGFWLDSAALAANQYNIYPYVPTFYLRCHLMTGYCFIEPRK